MEMIARGTTIQNDLLAGERHAEKATAIGDPLQRIGATVDFAALAQEVERIAPRSEQPKGGRFPLFYGGHGTGFGREASARLARRTD